MITEYEIRVTRPWSPDVKKGQIINVNARRKVQLVRGGFAVLVDAASEALPDVANAEPVVKKKRIIKKKRAVKKDT